jgi:hypothetical protein
MHRYLCALSICFPIALDNAVFAATDAPSSGMLYNTTEVHSMTYRCNSARGDQIECNFEQASTRLKAEPKDLPNILNKARAQFNSEKPPTPDECKMFQDILAILDGSKRAPKNEALEVMTTIEKKDLFASAKAFQNYCQKPTEDNFIEVMKLDHDKNVRTCLVSVNSFRQVLKRVGSAWVTQSEPEGSCGVVQLSRFEADETLSGKSKFSYWKYVARKAITNPNAELFPGAKCSGLDESTYTYDWRAKTYQKSCDYIEFSPM